MNEASWRRLEFDKVKAGVVSYTISPAGRLLAERLVPSTKQRQVEAWLQETYEAAELLGSGASIPLSAMDGIDSFLSLLGKGRIYNEQELEQLSVWLTSVVQMKKYMFSKREIAPTISAYAESMYDCPVLRDELKRCIRYGQLTDQASPDLAYIRRHIYAAEDKIQKKMENALHKYRTALQEPVISKRHDRFVIAVKREHRKQVPGTVWDESASGQTLFVEPLDASELQVELQQWKADEERERTVILSRLSEYTESFSFELFRNVEAMASFDFITARAKLSRSYNGKKIELSDQPVVRLVGARHPLLGQHSVPLHVELGYKWKQLIITGPNTGGKTVTLKTIGLFVLMVQSGLLVPAEQGSEIGVFQHVIADVGDGQSLEQSLSTFSSHITVLKDMLQAAGPRALLLLDELAAGTDPSEGIALSIALLEQLLKKGALAGATTHFNEIKAFAARTPGCQNGKMAFDAETLKPLYRLEMGEAGESHAFAIARRFGLPEEVMRRAEHLLVRKENQFHETHTSEQSRNEKETQKTSSSAASDFINKNLKKADETKAQNPKEAKKPFEKGDAVWIYPLNKMGVVYRPADERGNVIVQIQGQKLTFNHKRLKLYIAKTKLYPGQNEEYDLDIVFESKENRKARKLMNRKHVDGLEIVTNEDELL
ncbi:DNA mismatch repair protein MutS [Paenibacillus sp. FSL A5-0031]|uniref:endonuclease MutS2 n=1 Tax=Paenibacillus sp. FSL A5-0031 TaxID=1920420 RepID=UPI00096EF218|nr:DNA mismatch repair protein MutS [Paenibacillus sp. FSL A5-0031]OME88166.1 DNA mismatch repair protein MutS [Paenibacillus sp. FSL A5-0031]